MADPVTLATISIGATAGGGILSAVGNIMGAAGKSSMYNYQAGVAAINQKIAKQNAAYQRQVGELQAQSAGLKARGEIGLVKATQGARGFDVAKGSNEAVRDSMQDIASHEQKVIRANAARRAYGDELKAMEFGTQAGMASAAADYAVTEGVIGTASSILGTVSSVSSKWLQADTAGVWDA